MSTRQDLFSERYCKELMKLRSQASHMPFSMVEQIIQETYGDLFQEEFESIDEVCLGSASIAQVHAATLKCKNELYLRFSVLRSMSGWNVTWPC